MLYNTVFQLASFPVIDFTVYLYGETNFKICASGND